MRNPSRDAKPNIVIITAPAGKNATGDISMAAAAKKPSDVIADAQEIIRKKNAEISSLNAKIRSLQRDNDTAEEIRRTVFGIAERDPAPPRWTTENRSGPSAHRGGPVTIWSDFHYGEIIDPDQIGGVNKFNPEIAARRVHKLVDTTIDLAFNHMGSAKKHYPGIVIMLGGDFISGDIHNELAKTNSRTTPQSVNEVVDLLTGALRQMADKFGRVFVPCVIGNHARITLKPEHKNAVYNNLDWSVYCVLKKYFDQDSRIQFLIPSQADCLFGVFGHRFMLTHGDNLGVRGGDGIIGALGPIMRGSIKLRTSSAEIGRDYDTLVLGHWHQYITLPGLIVNNSLKGFDEYAHLRLRAKYAVPSQALWFVHPQHGITAHWQVYLEPKAKGAAVPLEWVTLPKE